MTTPAQNKAWYDDMKSDPAAYEAYRFKKNAARKLRYDSDPEFRERLKSMAKARHRRIRETSNLQDPASRRTDGH